MNKPKFPIKVAENTSQLDRIERMLELVTNHLHIDVKIKTRDELIAERRAADKKLARQMELECRGLLKDWLHRMTTTAGSNFNMKVNKQLLIDSLPIEPGLYNVYPAWKADDSVYTFTAFTHPLGSDSLRCVFNLPKEDPIGFIIAKHLDKTVEFEDMFNLRGCRSFDCDFHEWWATAIDTAPFANNDILVDFNKDVVMDFITGDGSVRNVKFNNQQRHTLHIQSASSEDSRFYIDDFGSGELINNKEICEFLLDSLLLEEISIPAFNKWFADKYDVIMLSGQQSEKNGNANSDN